MKKALLLVNIIITLIIIAIMIIVFSKILGIALFGGPQYTAFKTISTEINDLCKEGVEGENRSFSMYLPDHSGTDEWNLRFFFMVFGKVVVTTEESFFGTGGNEVELGSTNSIALATRSYNEESKDKNDYLNDINDFVKGEEGYTELSRKELKDCREFDICGYSLESKKEKCGSFFFEANEGYEDITVTLTYAPSEAAYKKGKILVSIDRATVCGDRNCCGSEKEENCPLDCPGKCKVVTE